VVLTSDPSMRFVSALVLVLSLLSGVAAWADRGVTLASGRVMHTPEIAALIKQVRVQDPARARLNRNQIDALEANAEMFMRKPARIHLARNRTGWVRSFIANDPRWRFLDQAPVARAKLARFFDTHGLVRPANLQAP
jgi:hypothetical protein